MSELGSSSGDGERKTRKVRVHKMRPPSAPALSMSSSADRNAAFDAQITELIPGIADLSVSGSAGAGAMQASADLRSRIFSRDDVRKSELMELQSIFDMAKPNLVDHTPPPNGWGEQQRPIPRKIQLSHYQYEMINYQRMLMRKNVWFYRDRMNIPRGPCPLHVLKDAWVQGVVDENTLMWGHGLADWLPAKNVKLLLPLIRTPEVRFGSWFNRTFSLKPALNNIRAARKNFRNPESLSAQVEDMR
eukprot:gene1346-32707_t